MNDESRLNNRSGWTTFWDRRNKRVMILSSGAHWAFVRIDEAGSAPGAYTIWRGESGHLLAAEILLDDADNPIAFPDELLDRRLLGSPTIWPYPNLDSFMWWHSPIQQETE